MSHSAIPSERVAAMVLLSGENATRLVVESRAFLQSREVPQPENRAIAADTEPFAVARHGHEFGRAVCDVE